MKHTQIRLKLPRRKRRAWFVQNVVCPKLTVLENQSRHGRHWSKQENTWLNIDKKNRGIKWVQGFDVTRDEWSFQCCTFRNGHGGLVHEWQADIRGSRGNRCTTNTHQGSRYPDVLRMKPIAWLQISSWPWLSFLLTFECSWPINEAPISHEM